MSNGLIGNSPWFELGNYRSLSNGLCQSIELVLGPDLEFMTQLRLEIRAANQQGARHDKDRDREELTANP